MGEVHKEVEKRKDMALSRRQGIHCANFNVSSFNFCASRFDLVLKAHSCTPKTKLILATLNVNNEDHFAC